MHWILVRPPPVEPLTAAELRARQNIGDEVSDAVLNDRIAGAREFFDGIKGWLARGLITQTWRGKLDAFASCNGRIDIPLAPLQQVVISYIDANGDTVTMIEGVDYRVKAEENTDWSYIMPLAAWPSVTGIDIITIDFTVGYGDRGADVPERIRAAISMGAGHPSSARDSSIIQEVVEGLGSTRWAEPDDAYIERIADRLVSNFRKPVL
jgi:uncharacterized phiE125 gp8 family phage protein